MRKVVFRVGQVQCVQQLLLVFWVHSFHSTAGSWVTTWQPLCLVCLNFENPPFAAGFATPRVLEGKVVTIVTFLVDPERRQTWERLVDSTTIAAIAVDHRPRKLKWCREMSLFAVPLFGVFGTPLWAILWEPGGRFVPRSTARRCGIRTNPVPPRWASCVPRNMTLASFATSKVLSSAVFLMQVFPSLSQSKRQSMHDIKRHLSIGSIWWWRCHGGQLDAVAAAHLWPFWRWSAVGHRRTKEIRSRQWSHQCSHQCSHECG